MADVFNIAGRIHSTSQEEVVTTTNEILDATQEKKQSEVNQEVNEELALHTNRLNALTGQNYVTVVATQSTTAADIPTLINASGEGEQTDTLYRVGFWDGSAYVADKYTEYAWNGTAYVILDVKSSIGEVFDISQYNAVGGTLTPYVDLEAALSGTNVPTTVHQGGMSVKFIQTSDNKYLQCRLMSSDWSIDTNNWAICSDTILIENEEYIGAYTDRDGRFLVGIRRADGHVIYGAGVPPQIVEYINNKIAELHLDKVEDIIAFLGDLIEGDNTLQQLLNEKVDKEDGKELMSSDLAETLSMVDEPEYMNAETDSEGKVLGGRKADGPKFENMPFETPAARFESIEDAEGRLDVYKDAESKVMSYRDKSGTLHEYGIEAKQAKFKNVNVEDMHFEGDIPQQIKDYVQSYVPEDNHDEIPYNDLLSVGNRVIKTYNPYKEQKQHQYTGQMHCHSWTKFADTDYPAGFPSEKWKVPYGYSIGAIPAGETNTEKYLWGMPHEKVVAILNALAMAYIWRHKKLGYNFVALSDYARFEDVTHKPNLSDITYLQTEYPDAYTYFAGLYLDGFDVNDFDADGNLKDFCWLCDSYETTTLTLGVLQHMVVHGAGNTSEPYQSGTFNDVMKRVEDKGCIAQWPHPTDIGTYASPEVIATVKKRLRLIEIYDGISIRKYDQNGNLTNREAVVSGVMLDEPFDEFLKQGNFIFGMAISDERPAYGRTGEAMFTLNPALNLKNGCIKVFCDALNSAEIFESILNGNFYASSSSDASINSVSIENGQYTVDVGVEGVVVEFVKEDNTIVKTVTTSAGNTTASYDIDGSEKFVRARIYKLNALPYDSGYWYKNKEWMIWTQPLLISNTIL